MKKALVLGLVAVLVMGLAGAAHAKAQKADLYVFREPDKVVGFVIFNTSHLAAEGYRLTVLVSLKQGKSEVWYKVEVRAESLDSEDYNIFLAGEFTTNHRGHGNLQLKSGPGDVLSRGTWSFAVVVWIEGDNRTFVAYSDIYLK